MQYLLMLYVNEAGWRKLTPAEKDQGVAAYKAYMEALTKAGALKGGNRLQASQAATTVRVANGKPQVLDGPYADSKEQLGGYFLIDVADLDAAIAWAARCPAASHGVVEVRPLWGTVQRELAPVRDRMSPRQGEAPARSTADAVARRSYGKLVAFLAARTRDVAAAEDALSDAFAAALADWPRKGCPANPEAWLLTVARRKLVDAGRWRRSGEAFAQQLQLLTEGLTGAAAADIPDHRLALMFACTHPAVETGIRAPLILQVVLGLNAETIASAFLTSPAAMGKRLVRAKEQIRKAGIPFAVPERGELRGRLDTVLDAIYAAFAEGWTDPGGSDVVRRDLTDEALFLARLATGLLPDEPEALGLFALMLHAEARRRARRNARGEYVPLAEQDPALWDSPMIVEAEALLRQASALGAIGRYQLEGALQSAHVHRRRTGQANWAEVIQLYDALLTLSGSPVVAINRALVVAEMQGPGAGLEAMQTVAGDMRLVEYQPYWAARAELLAKAGAHAEARRAYAVAIGLERDAAVRHFLQRRQSALPA